MSQESTKEQGQAQFKKARRQNKMPVATGAPNLARYRNFLNFILADNACIDLLNQQELSSAPAPQAAQPADAALSREAPVVK